MPTEQRKPAWRLACLVWPTAKRREGASNREAHEGPSQLYDLYCLCLGKMRTPKASTP